LRGINTNEQEKKVLEDIYASVPHLGDCTGCSECCGPVRWLTIEDENIREYLREHGIPFREKVIPPVEILKMMLDEEADRAMSCPYATKQGCEIYPVRPLICRVFGVVREDLECPKLAAKETITSKEVSELYRKLAEMRGDIRPRVKQ
jgi:Fe-S-cluster containining protein